MSEDLQSPALAACLLFYIKWCRVAYPLSVYRHFIPHIATKNWSNSFDIWLLRTRLVRVSGFEPETPWLKAKCSSNWATPAYLVIGGEWGIWTLGAFTPDSFQDCCIKPLCQLSIKLRDISTASIPSRWAPLYIPEEGRGIQLKCLWRNGRDSNPRTRNLA